MATLPELAKRVKALKRRKAFYKNVLRIAKRFEAYLIDLNQLNLSQGRDIFGEIIGTYSQATEEIAKTEFTVRPKVAGRNYNFEWSGEFFRGMRLKISAEYIEFISVSEESPLILAKFSNIFGEQVVLGLSEDAIAEFAQDKLIPELQKYTWEALGLNG